MSPRRHCGPNHGPLVAPLEGRRAGCGKPPQHGSAGRRRRWGRNECHPDRYVRMELRPLEHRLVRAFAGTQGSAPPVHTGVRHSRAERELLPMAAAADVPRMESSATARIPDEREGTPRPQPRPASVSARDMDLSAGGLLARARGATRTWHTTELILTKLLLTRETLVDHNRPSQDRSPDAP